MASELEKAVTDLLARVVDGVDGATALVEAELPEFITQLLLWHGLSETVYGVLFSGAAIWLLHKIIIAPKVWLLEYAAALVK